jgi:predicted HicB family RNase H-like nuclease
MAPRTHSKQFMLWLTPRLHARLMAVKTETGKPVTHWLRLVIMRALDEREHGRPGSIR